MMDQPKLRPIEAFPVNVGGRDVVYLRDPTDLAVNPLLVPHETLLTLAHFDGKHSILDIQEAYTRAKLAEPHNRRRICGFPPIYMLLSTLPASAGMVLKYDQSVEPATQSMVSYASVVFY